jgi:hypothetical protein
MDTPSPNGDNGRDARGRFAPGHQGGPGNPLARRSAAIRTAFIEAISPQDIRAIVRTLVAKATAGDLVAAKLILLWAIGRPDDPVHPDGVAARLAAQTGDVPQPQPLPDDREARLDFAARELAAEIITLRGQLPALGGVGVSTLGAQGSGGD